MFLWAPITYVKTDVEDTYNSTLKVFISSNATYHKA